MYDVCVRPDSLRVKSILTKSEEKHYLYQRSTVHSSQLPKTDSLEDTYPVETL